jgi:protein-ribulosamine 3-kinase
MVPKTVFAWCQKQGYGDVIASKPIGGGCINEGAILTTSSGKTLFLKTNQHCPPIMFTREAEGLIALCVENGPRVPKVFLFEENFILLEDLAPKEGRKGFWEIFGRQMATLHNHTYEKFGFPNDNYIGSTPQPNPWTADGYLFFTENRLVYQARLALASNRLELKDLKRVEFLGHRLPELVPKQKASLIHGDLWSGNVTTDSQGMPAIIDPAAHYGWAEADLAMTDLFGTFPERFYNAYREHCYIENGFRDRFPIYNLYHLINHLNLFGLAYRGQVLAILDRFC